MYGTSALASSAFGIGVTTDILTEQEESLVAMTFVRMDNFQELPVSYEQQ